MWSRRGFLESAGLGLAAAAGAARGVGAGRSSAAAADAAMEHIVAGQGRLRAAKRRMLGFPINMNAPPAEFFAWRRQLCAAGVNAFAYNNVGDPFQPSPIPYNTHALESEAIRRFAELYRFPPQDAWGFIAHSGADGNMHGMYLGRTLLKQRTGRLPVAYFTREAHYSVQILSDLLGLEAEQVATLGDGGMDPAALGEAVARRGEAPALVVATLGTTFQGAIDPLDAVRQVLAGRPSYVHLDAALFGGYLPYTPHAAATAHRTSEADAAGRYDSLAVSCHKFFGFPSPAGIFLTRRSLFDEFHAAYSRVHNPEYIGHVPGTITCSRDGVKPAEFAYFAQPAARPRLVADAERMLANAAALREELDRRLPHLEASRANPLSNTVFFRRPRADVVAKYSLATMEIVRAGRREPFAHVVVMPHATRDVLAELLADLETAEA
jgi:histidine decarboxylase